MRKKFFMFAALAAAMTMGFTACSNNIDEIADSQALADGAIGWDIHAKGTAVTRGDATGSANALSQITAFQTWAYDDETDGLYMGGSATSGRTVNNTGTALAPEWTYSPSQFWPVHALNFVAITPATDASITGNSTASADNVVTLTTNVTLSTDVEDQKDIMMAKGDGVTKNTDGGNVPFEFEHALSQIVFKGKFNDQGAVTKVTIAEISLCNINKTGVLTYTSEGTWYGGNTKPASVSTPATFTLEGSDLEGTVFDVNDVVTPAVLYADYTEYNEDKGTSIDAAAFEALSDAEKTKTPAVKRGTTAFDLTVSNGSNHNAWFMIPQTTTAWEGPIAIDATPASGSYLKVRAQLEKDGVVILGNAEADALYIPLAANWDRNKKYIYTIEFNGEGALTPITFSVEAQDWQQVEKSIPEVEKPMATLVSAPSGMTTNTMSPGLATGGTLMYASTSPYSSVPSDPLTELSWSSDFSTITGLPSAGGGKWKVWYYVQGDADHSDTVPTYVEVDGPWEMP